MAGHERRARYAGNDDGLLTRLRRETGKGTGPDRMQDDMSSLLTDDVRLGTLLVVSDVSRSRDFYTDVLGAKVLREFEGSFCQLEFRKALLFVVAAGGPSKDKPGILPRRRTPKRWLVKSFCGCRTASPPTRHSKAEEQVFSRHQ